MTVMMLSSVQFGFLEGSGRYRRGLIGFSRRHIAAACEAAVWTGRI